MTTPQTPYAPKMGTLVNLNRVRGSQGLAVTPTRESGICLMGYLTYAHELYFALALPIAGALADFSTLPAKQALYCLCSVQLLQRCQQASLCSQVRAAVHQASYWFWTCRC